MNIGYARTSTAEQMAGLEAQLAELQAVHCEKIFQEQVSSHARCTGLKAAIDFAREGDLFVVTKIDRLARSVTDLLTIIQTLHEKKVGIRILNLGMNTQTPTGKMILTVLASVAQFEREIMLECQREVVAKAKAAGKYKGRKPISFKKQKEVMNLVNKKTPKTAIAKELEIGEATVYRILKQRGKSKSMAANYQRYDTPTRL
ncbi:MAG: recombinase family protein [Gammaproteobacteria bacterium]|jgi:DNA invertase Pin-like site-specific DNA recombinase|nr:recombinase family protein [Gammaproteobacteria bacterium]